MARPQVVTEANAEIALAYAFQMPADWQKLAPPDGVAPSGPGLQLLGRYGPPGDRWLVEVLTQVLEYEVSSADWLAVWLAANELDVVRGEAAR